MHLLALTCPKRMGIAKMKDMHQIRIHRRTACFGVHKDLAWRGNSMAMNLRVKKKYRNVF